MEFNTEQFPCRGECKLGDYTIDYLGLDVKPIELRRDGENALLFTNGDESETYGLVTVKDNDDALYINKLWNVSYYAINNKVVNVIFQGRGY